MNDSSTHLRRSYYYMHPRRSYYFMNLLPRQGHFRLYHQRVMFREENKLTNPNWSLGAEVSDQHHHLLSCLLSCCLRMRSESSSPDTHSGGITIHTCRFYNFFEILTTISTIFIDIFFSQRSTFKNCYLKNCYHNSPYCSSRFWFFLNSVM